MPSGFALSTFQNILLLLTVIACFSSCATLNYKRSMVVIAHTDSPSKISYNDRSVNTSANMVRLTVKRQNKPLVLTIVTADSVSKQVIIKPMIGKAYWMNFTNFGVGYLLELVQPKRFAYPKNIYLYSSDKDSTPYTDQDPYRQRRPNPLNAFFGKKNIKDQKGKFFLHVSIPYANDLKLIPDGEPRKDMINFFGITTGLDYFHSAHQYVNFSATAISDISIPVIAPLDRFNDYELSRSRYLSLTNNHVILNHFSVGYGLSYSINEWEFVPRGHYGDTTATISQEPVIKGNHALGLMFSSYCRIIAGLNVGVVYRPSFIRLGANSASGYEHLISFDIAYKVPLDKWPWQRFRRR